jgi:excisionase family DNA binding protein
MQSRPSSQILALEAYVLTNSRRTSPLSLPQVARELNVSDASVRRWIRLGLLPANVVGPGKRYRVDPADLYHVRERVRVG